MSPSVLEQIQAHKSGSLAAQQVTARIATRPLVGGYARISDAYEDAETGVTEGGVKRQQKVNELLTEARGWDLHERLYVDNSVSAYKAGVVRDAFEAMLEDLTNGIIDGVVCYNLDRLARRVNDLERVIEVYDAGRRSGRQMYFATNEGSIDLSSDDGITLARIMVAFANKASRDTGRRVALKHQESRDEGRNTGGARPFGWSREKDASDQWVYTHHPREAAAIRDGAARLIDGTTSWYGLLLEWNEAGLRTARGKEWTTNTIKQMFTSPRLAGWLVHQGKIAVHSRTGELIRSQAPAILTDEEYEALLVATETESKGFSSASGRERYLLSGLLLCKQCGSVLVGNRHFNRKRGKEYFYYVCHRNGARAGDGTSLACGKVSASMPALDEMIERLVLPIVVEHTNGLATKEEIPHQEEMVGNRAKREEWASKLRSGEAPSDIALPIINELDKRADAIRREQAKARRRAHGAQRAAGVTEKTWPALSLAERRAHVRRYIKAIYILPAEKRVGNRFDPSRVLPPVWQTGFEPASSPASASR